MSSLAIRPLAGRENGLLARPRKQKSDAAAARHPDENKKELVKTSRVITSRDYPEIAELKLAGRNDEQIAHMFEVPLDNIRGPIAKAMSLLRKGELEIDRGKVFGEALEVGREKGAEVSRRIPGATFSVIA